MPRVAIFAPCVGYLTKDSPTACQDGSSTGEAKGGVSMAFLLTDLLLFSALAVWVTGMVIAIASLLS